MGIPWSLFTMMLTFYQSSNQDETTSASLSVGPVRVTTFYECLCPDCLAFFRSQLEPSYRRLGPIIDVQVYAYGNIHETELVSASQNSSFSFECQHGPAECHGNTVLECAKKHIRSRTQFLQFTFCVMRDQHPAQAGPKCALETGVPLAPIAACASSPEGSLLLHEAGLAQSKMAPGINSVPWILINDEYDSEAAQEAQEDLTALVCTKYEGGEPLPDACFGRETDEQEVK